MLSISFRSVVYIFGFSFLYDMLSFSIYMYIMCAFSKVLHLTVQHCFLCIVHLLHYIQSHLCFYFTNPL